MPPTEDSSNARRFKRVPLVGKSTLIFPDENKTLTGMIDNINLGGVGLLTKKPLPLRKTVLVRLEFSDPHGKTVTEDIHGRIIRSTPWNRIFISGIQFDSVLTLDDHPHLFRFLKDAESK